MAVHGDNPTDHGPPSQVLIDRAAVRLSEAMHIRRAGWRLDQDELERLDRDRDVTSIHDESTNKPNWVFLFARPVPVARRREAALNARPRAPDATHVAAGANEVGRMARNDHDAIP